MNLEEGTTICLVAMGKLDQGVALLVKGVSQLRVQLRPVPATLPLPFGAQQQVRIDYWENDVVHFWDGVVAKKKTTEVSPCQCFCAAIRQLSNGGFLPEFADRFRFRSPRFIPLNPHSWAGNIITSRPRMSVREESSLRPAFHCKQGID